MIVRYLLLVLMLVISPSAVKASDSNAPKAAATLIMAFSESVPWKIINPDGSYSGIDVELARLIAQRLNTKLEIKAAPLARCLEMMRRGEADLMTNIIRSADREQYIRYLNVPYQRQSNKVFYLRADNPLDIRSYEDLYGLEIGIKRGAKYNPRFDLDTALNKRDVTVALRNFKKLSLGRIDAVLSTESEGDYLIQHNRLQGYYKKATLKFNQPLQIYLGLSRQSPFVGRAAEIERILTELINNGELEHLTRRYLMSS